VLRRWWWNCHKYRRGVRPMRTLTRSPCTLARHPAVTITTVYWGPAPALCAASSPPPTGTGRGRGDGSTTTSILEHAFRPVTITVRLKLNYVLHQASVLDIAPRWTRCATLPRPRLGCEGGGRGGGGSVTSGGRGVPVRLCLLSLPRTSWPEQNTCTPWCGGAAPLSTVPGCRGRYPGCATASPCASVSAPDAHGRPVT
jgi:hypothetical protein